MENAKAYLESVLAHLSSGVIVVDEQFRLRSVNSSAVQILGGMGFTWEMLPHYFLKRAWVLEHAFGTGEWHAARLGDAVAAR